MDPTLQVIVDKLNKMETKMSSGQEKIKNDKSAIQDKTSTDISAIMSRKAKFEEKMTDKLENN
jgi:hypothetical protein